jgi:hypothetical protein
MIVDKQTYEHAKLARKLPREAPCHAYIAIVIDDVAKNVAAESNSWSQTYKPDFSSNALAAP